MRNATILDAFNAAAGFAGNLLDMKTEKDKELNIFDINNNNAMIQTNIMNWTRDNPYIGADNEEEDEVTYRNYLNRFESFVNEEFARAGRRNNSPYYQRMMGQMRLQSQEQARNYTLGEADKWRIQREHLHMGEDINRYLEAHKTGDWDPQQALEAIYNRIDFAGTKIDLDPQQRSQMRRLAEAALYQQHAINILEQVNDVNKLEDAWKEIREAFEFLPAEILNTYDEDGNITGTEERAWSFEGKDEWDKALEEREKARIQREHFEVIWEKES